MKKFIAFLLLFVCAFVFFGCGEKHAEDVMPTSVKINETNVKVEVDDTVTLTATVEPANATSKSVEWSSDNTAVATVTKATGVVKGIAAGKATITVTCKADSKISASIEVTVEEGEQGPVAVLESIEIVGAAQVSVGGQATLTINSTPANASKEVTWASDDESVLTVDADGKVTGVAEGTAKVTATSKADATKKAEKTIEVVAGEVGTLTGISISATQSYAIDGETIKLTAVATPEGADNSVTWSSSDPDIATIDEEGYVTAVEGCVSKEVTFTATSTVDPSIVATRKISIVALADVVYTIGLTINNVPVGNKLALNKTVQLGHTSTGPVDPDTQQNKKVTNTSVSWEVDNENVATIEDGLLTPVAAGEVVVTITALDGSLDEGGNPLTKSVTITIYEPKAPTTWTVEASRDISNGFEFGKDLSLKITVGDEEDASATFTSSNDAIATIDENGKITSFAEGEVTFTATSVLDPTKTASVKVNFVEKIVIDDTPTSISITGENELYVGYSITLIATVLPLTAVQTITWTSSDESIATVDQNGKVSALKAGTVRIKVTSAVAKTVYANFKVTITDEPEPEPIPNMGGYEIIIMNAESALTDNDPFLDGYSQADKTFKQKAWREVEEAYNCTIKVVAYPASAPWGNARIDWIKDNAAANTSQCDLGIISSNWIYKFAQSDAAIDVTKYYNTYGKKQMEPAQKQAGTYKNKLYTASTGTSQTGTSVDLGLFYNLGWLEELGLEDPATMFNDGRWTYTNFEAWVMSAQAKIGDSSQPKRALGGHPYYYYYGMTNAAGVKIADSVLVKTNISSQASKNAGALIWKLTDAGCVNTTATWAESAGEHDFLTGDVLMTTGFLWFVRTDNRWKKDMWGDDTRYGYVPFPYPDDVAKENTRIGVSGLSVYLYVNGRPYPAGVTSKDVYRAMNDMFLNTIKYQEADDNFDPYSIKYNSLKSRIDNEASIEAIMYYDSSKVFYDPAHSIYDSIAATVLKSPCVYVMYQGKDWDESFDAVAESYESLFKEIYS